MVNWLKLEIEGKEKYLKIKKVENNIAYLKYGDLKNNIAYTYDIKEKKVLESMTWGEMQERYFLEEDIQKINERVIKLEKELEKARAKQKRLKEIKERKG